MAAWASNFASIWTYIGCWKRVVKRHWQLATTLTHCKSHWNTRRTPTGCLIAASRSVPSLHGVHSPCSHRSVVQWCGHMRCPCVYCFVSSMSGIAFNPSADAIIDHIQSAKDIDPYFKSQLYVKDPGHRKSVLSLSNGLTEPGERAHGRNFTFCRGWDSNPKPLVKRVTTELSPLSEVCMFTDIQSPSLTF